MDRSRRQRRWGRIARLAVLAVLVGVGLAVATLGPAEPEEILDRARAHAHGPWLPLAAVAAQAVLFTLALPGSVVLWAVAPLYPPPAATAILVAGSTLGALGGYLFAAHLGREVAEDGQPGRVRAALARRGDVLTQLAMRTFPGFPHSVINYAAGALRLPLIPFLAAAVAGLTVKWGVYTTAIHGVIEAASPEEAIGPATVAPLLALALLLAVGAAVRRWVVGRR